MTWAFRKPTRVNVLTKIMHACEVISVRSYLCTIYRKTRYRMCLKSS
jgi:hypothetical protein